MINTIVVDNFFNNFSNIKDEFKKIKLYTFEEQQKLNIISKNVIWPGKRSDLLNITHPFLFNLIIKEFLDKFGYHFSFNHIKLASIIHLRLLEDDKTDYIHTDENIATLIVYLSDTNLNSGTVLYPNNSDEPDIIIKSIQNRAVLFDAKKRHKSLLNYGDSIENGRLTLNIFINEGKND
jgi:hypothetical protein